MLVEVVKPFELDFNFFRRVDAGKRVMTFLALLQTSWLFDGDETELAYFVYLITRCSGSWDLEAFKWKEIFVFYIAEDRVFAF